MDHESLRTASTYLNNLLLSRGLLRNSTAIDFVKPSKESRAQIINLVHDLILREDRDATSREQTAITVRNLRADEARKNAEIEKLREKSEEAARGAVAAQAAERAAQLEVKRVEKALRSLQDQAAKLKVGLAQVRMQCANDVRKRDLELARLKTHLQGQQRGNKVGMAAPSMAIVNGGRGRGAFDASVHDLRDPEYSLKQETTEFLTQLSQSLSDENDGLIGLVRGTLGTMRELLGLSATAQKHPDSAIGSTNSDEVVRLGVSAMLQAQPTSYEILAADVEDTLSHLKAVLSNPTFVAIEEVEVRDEEITRLREGWVRMEQRWKDVLVMMDGWRRKMDTGDTINIDDLRKGMGMVSPERQRNGALLPETELSYIDEEDDVSATKLPGNDLNDTSVFLEPPRLSSPALAKSSPKRKRDILEPPEFFDLRPSTSSRSGPPSPQAATPVDQSDGDTAEAPESSTPRMTIEEKLRLAQDEAEEAAAAALAAKEAELQAASAKRAAVDEGEGEGDDTLGKMLPSAVKKTRIRGRPKRRKSTLSAEELEELMTSAIE